MTRKDWLDFGLVVIGNEGVSGLKLERLCELAGKTRGSFYHHFEDHNEFVVALLECWQVDSAERIIDSVRHITNAREQRVALARQVVGLSSAIENAIRGWSGTDERAYAVVTIVDAARLEFLQKGIITLASESGITLTPEEAEDLAILDYGLFIGVHALKKDASPDYYFRLNELSENMLNAWMAKKSAVIL